MKKYRFLRISGIIILLIVFLGCSAEDGMDGAVGPQGEQGIQGVPGENGNANVITSAWLNVTFSAIISNIISATIIDDRINQELIEDSVFLLYARDFNTPDRVVPIPFTEPILNVSYYYVMDGSLNQVEILGVSLDGSAPIPDLFDQVRFVIIPAGTDPSSLDNFNYDTLITNYGL
ncbi:MAG: hypothetical protein AAF361_10550, partial [Bacteroidota bacterium]